MNKKILKHLTVTGFASSSDLSNCEVLEKELNEAKGRLKLSKKDVKNAKQKLDKALEEVIIKIDAKKKELADLQKQREAALKKEQDAVKAQRIMDNITQVSSLITAAAKTLKAFWGPQLPIGIALVAAMFAAFAAAKAKAAKVSGFAKGGWTGPGTYRDNTGEKVSGYVHQEEYVVRRGPAFKHRELLEAINKDDKKLIINRLNKFAPSHSTSVVVENEGPNKRLDQLIQLNRNSKEEVIVIGNKTIIKKGNSTKTIYN